MKCFLCEKEMRPKGNFGEFDFFCWECELGFDQDFLFGSNFCWRGSVVSEKDLERIKKIRSFQ